MFKVNNTNTRAMCEINMFKVNNKALERCQ